MNKADYRRMQRLYDSVRKIPKAASGTHSTTVAGITGYGLDMAEFQAWATNYFFNTMLEYNWRNCPDEIESEWPNYVAPDEMLNRLERWIKLRQSQQWELSGSIYGIPRIMDQIEGAADESG